MAHLEDIPAVNNDGNIVDFINTNTTDSFKFKQKQQVKLVIMEEQIMLK